MCALARVVAYDGEAISQDHATWVAAVTPARYGSPFGGAGGLVTGALPAACWQPRSTG